MRSSLLGCRDVCCSLWGCHTSSLSPRYHLSRIPRSLLSIPQTAVQHEQGTRLDEYSWPAASITSMGLLSIASPTASDTRQALWISTIPCSAPLFLSRSADSNDYKDTNANQSTLIVTNIEKHIRSVKTCKSPAHQLV